MYKDSLTNTHIRNVEILVTPAELKKELSMSASGRNHVDAARHAIADIIHRRDHRLLVVCGPCSIHNPSEALAYARKLKTLQLELKTQLFIVMRVYFEKPRTSIGWKGLINDPHMDGSFDLNHGLRVARQLLLDLVEMELPLATEALDPISPQYLGELFSWAAIGARTTESQTHREMASGLSMPVGFKNGTDGTLDVAINAMQAASTPHQFMGINQDGQVSIVSTEGNSDIHLILRGGRESNYDSISVAECEVAMRKAGLPPVVMVDCSHANSRKDYRRQSLVAKDVAQQIRDGNRSILGMMLESYLQAGAQPLPDAKEQLQPGLSVTDACMDFETTETLLRDMAGQLAQILPTRR